MPPARVVEILNVIGHCHAQFNYGGPSFTVEKFGLHSSPERFDHGIVIAITDRAQAEFKSVVTHVAGECPGRKLSEFNRLLQHLLIGVTVVVR